MTTAPLPHGHASRRLVRLMLVLLSLAFAAPALAATSSQGPAPEMLPVPAPVTLTPAATPAKLAPISLTAAEAAPLVQQLQTLQAATAATATSDRIKTVLDRAFALLGTPYRWGGTSPDRGFDCSGLVGYVFQAIGIDLPRVSRAMATQGMAIADRTALAEGDLVFFGRRGRVDHVGIYIGDGKFLHAPRTGRDVTVSSLASGYWANKYLQARRIAIGD